MKRNILFTVISLVLCVVLAVSVFNIVKIVKNKSPEIPQYASRIIEYGGEKYFPKQDITTFMFLGLDRTGPAVASNSYMNSARADVVMVLVFDDTAREIRILNLNRDTILPVQRLGVNGFPADTTEQQLALAHTYGKGLKDSCENTKITLSKYLLNLQIDYFASVSMDQIATINDRLGGVTVEVIEDFSSVDPKIPQGSVTLSGEQAKAYISYRRDVDDQLNLSRMERQKKYMFGMFERLNAVGENNTEDLLKLYDDISDYVVTDCTTQTMTNLLNKFAGYELKEVISPKGENVKGTEFMEYYVDAVSLKELVLDLFYSKK